MRVLQRGEQVGCTNPAIEVFHQEQGRLRDVHALSISVHDRTGDSEVQIVPLSGRLALDVVNACPAGARLGVGHYVATFTVPADAAQGTHVVRWYLQASAAAPEVVIETEFEVTDDSTVGHVRGYCTTADLRAEGVDISGAAYARMLRVIDLASRYIDTMTGRYFEPRKLTLIVDGSAAAALVLPEPIVGIEAVAVISYDLYPPALTSDVPLDELMIYNRHLVQRIVYPDDRNEPKLMYRWPGWYFAQGRQNVTVTGVFGYTDPDHASQGVTPALVRDVCKKLVLRELPVLTNSGARETARQRHRIISEKTTDQSYTLQPAWMRGAYTGDPEIDHILSRYRRPPAIACA